MKTKKKEENSGIADERRLTKRDELHYQPQKI